MSSSAEEGQLLRAVQDFFNYTDEQIKAFGDHPDKVQFAKAIPAISGTKLRFNVVKAHGCGCQYQVGQKIVINADASIAVDECPPKICVFLMQALSPLVLSSQEFICEGLSPDQLKFKQVTCFDPGVMCGGIGNVVVEMGGEKRSA